VSFDIGNMLLHDASGAPIAASGYPTFATSNQMVGTWPASGATAGYGMDNYGAGHNNIGVQTLTVAGNSGTEHLNIPAGATAKEVADLVNSIKTETSVEASARTIAYLRELTGDGIIGFKMYGSNSAGIDVSADVTKGDLTNLATSINDVSEKTGINAVLSVDKASIMLVNEDGYDIGIEDFFSSNTDAGPPAGNQIVVSSPTTVGEDPFTPVGYLPADSAVILDGGDPSADSTRVGGRVTFFSQYSYRVETSEAGPPYSLISGEKVYPSKISINDIDISTREGANVAIRSVDAALTAVSSNRAKLGAIQNRFESAITNLQAVSENLSAARSRIRDTDYAAETSNMASAQILQQAGISMMTQANALPQNVLNLLQGL
jgi:flagellin